MYFLALYYVGTAEGADLIAKSSDVLRHCGAPAALRSLPKSSRKLSLFEDLWENILTRECYLLIHSLSACGGGGRLFKVKTCCSPPDLQWELDAR